MCRPLNMRLLLLTGLFALAGSGSLYSQSKFEEYKRRADRKFEQYRVVKQNEFEAYRKRVNEEFARFMEQQWNPVKFSPEEKPPVAPTPPPVIEDIDTVPPVPPRPIVIIDTVPIPEPVPQPEPIEPIIEKDEDDARRLDVTLYGTDFSVRVPDMSGFRLTGSKTADFAAAWKWLSDERTNNLIADCLKEREEKALCDWAYLSLLSCVANRLSAGDKNKSILILSFLFCQSGYKMRLVHDSAGQLHLFYAPVGMAYNTPNITVDGDRYCLFDNGVKIAGDMKICKFSFPKEQQLSFEISRPMNLAYSPSPVRRVTAQYHPEVSLEVAVNKNLIDFYDRYPNAIPTMNPYSKWTIHANTPASPEISRSVYPVLAEAVRGKSQVEAVNILLHLAQSFNYGYDDDIWGGDRAFFMDESWYYPLSDCEDHAVNFTRMVRDVMNLDAVLIYYPEHLAAAVAFTEPDVEGDYVMYGGKKFTVCDPTIFYSNVGRTMKGMDNSSAILIPLK